MHYSTLFAIGITACSVSLLIAIALAAQEYRNIKRIHLEHQRIHDENMTYMKYLLMQSDESMSETNK